MENILSRLDFSFLTDDFSRNRKKYIILGAVFASMLVLQVVCGVVTGCKARPQPAVAADVSGTDVVVTVDENGEEVLVPAEPDEEHSRIVIVPMLINTEHVMSEDFMPNNLVRVGEEVKGTASLQINATVREAYLVMQKDMEAQGVKLPMVISAYRSYAKQKELYNAKVAQYGINQKVTAVPGTSEHQYSASVDISTDGTCQNNFGELPTGIWIAENSYKYGFVVRYPEDKKELTGINFEPWHIRYVGVEHATAMYEMDMCLEEYTEYLWANYPNAIEEVSPDQFPAPRWAGDMGDDSVPSSSDASLR